jgi:hypothetical protein
VDQSENDCTLQSQEGLVPYSLNLLEARCPTIAKNLEKFNDQNLPMRILKYAGEGCRVFGFLFQLRFFGFGFGFSLEHWI